MMLNSNCSINILKGVCTRDVPLPLVTPYDVHVIYMYICVTKLQYFSLRALYSSMFSFFLLNKKHVGLVIYYLKSNIW